MKKEEFIEKWLVGYEDLEQKTEFSKEMMQDLESLTEPTQEGVVSAEEVEKIARKEILDAYKNPTSNVHGQYIGFQKGYHPSNAHLRIPNEGRGDEERF